MVIEWIGEVKWNETVTLYGKTDLIHISLIVVRTQFAHAQLKHSQKA
jgi:hypothetical protein